MQCKKQGPLVISALFFFFTPGLTFPLSSHVSQSSFAYFNTIHPHSDICQHLDTTARDCYSISIEVLEQALSASAVEAMQLRDEAAALQVVLSCNL